MLEVEPGSLSAWILAARPATLAAAFAPVAVGTACAWHVDAFRWDAALSALTGAFLIQIATSTTKKCTPAAGCSTAPTAWAPCRCEHR